MEEGWVKLYRKIEHNDFLMTDNNAFVVFMKLLIFADKHTGSYRAATRTLAERIHMPHSTVYKVLRRLELEGIIHLEPHEHYSKIWLTNWASYQSNREIDAILEHNVPLHRKQDQKRPEKRILQIRKALPQTATETQRKRKGNARETYNKKENKENTISAVKARYPQLEPELTAFIEHRQKLRAALTASALDLIIKKLERLYPGSPELQKACLNQSIERGWKGVFEVHDLTTASRHRKETDGWL